MPPATATKLTKIKVSIMTADEENADTDASVYLAFCLNSGGGMLFLLPNQKGNDNERGVTTVYPLGLNGGPAVEDICGVVLINGMNGEQPGWKIKQVLIEAMDETGRSWMLVKDEKVNRWLNTSATKGPATVLPLKKTILGMLDVVGAITSTIKPL